MRLFRDFIKVSNCARIPNMQKSLKRDFNAKLSELFILILYIYYSIYSDLLSKMVLLGSPKI